MAVCNKAQFTLPLIFSDWLSIILHGCGRGKKVCNKDRFVVQMWLRWKGYNKDKFVTLYMQLSYGSKAQNK